MDPKGVSCDDSSEDLPPIRTPCARRAVSVGGGPSEDSMSHNIPGGAASVEMGGGSWDLEDHGYDTTSQEVSHRDRLASPSYQLSFRSREGYPQ